MGLPWVKHRTANVVVVNETGIDIAAVSLIHKYSDNYVNNTVWNGPIKNGGTTSPPLKVDYHTGAGTTGMDWWRVTWIDTNKVLYATDPHNFQGMLNWFENILKKNANWAALALLKKAPEAAEMAPFVVAAAAAIKGIDVMVLNDATTVGFKENMLRSNDDGKTVTITLHSDTTVTISSPSGSSATQFKKIMTDDDT